jgi:uncharacterized protein involved in outer membrane biogenesis
MPPRRGATTALLALAAIVLLALIFAVPILLNVDRYRPRAISYLQEQTGKSVDIARLSLTLVPLTIHVDHFGVKNPQPIFPKGYVLEVARIDAGLSLGAILRGRIAIQSLVLEDPILNLTSDPDGPWNFENPQLKRSPNTLVLATIPSVKIHRGVVIASNLLPSDAAGPVFFEAHDISSELQQVNLSAISDPSSSSMDGRGSLKAGLLRFGSIEIRDLDSKLTLESRQALLTDLRAEIYGGKAAGALSFDLSGKNASFRTNARLSGINLAQLLAAFPNGGGKMTGKMEGDIKLAGEITHSLRPLAGIHGSGHVTVRNGQVPSLKLNANLMKLAHFNDLGPAKDDPSSFKLIATDLELGDQRISSRAIDIDGYGVDVDGSGSVSVSGSEELNYRGLAEITTKESFLTNTVARLSGASLKNGKLQFPFRVRGTIDSPVFSKGKGDIIDVDAPRRQR